MNIFYNWEFNFKQNFWFKNYNIKGDQIHRFVTIYCDEMFEVQFHRNYRVFQNTFGEFYPTHASYFNGNELLYSCDIDYLKNKLDQFLDKIPKLLSFI